MSAAVTGSGGDVVLVFLFLLLDDVVVDFLFSAMVFDAEWILGLVVVVDGDATWLMRCYRNFGNVSSAN